jgi:polynucleotide 5'-hydroxyl-kinase GRC3/NOL9
LDEHGTTIPLAGRTIPRKWDVFVAQLGTRKAAMVLLLGETDTGKTFFSTYCVNRLLAAGRTVGILDCDTGQSVIGPPATIGFAVLERPTVFLNEAAPQALYFTGSYSPASNFLEFGAGLARVLRQAQVRADIVLVNTPGWVQGDGGRLLVRSMIELVSPDHLVLFERGNELQYLKKRCGGLSLAAFAAADVPATSSEKRKMIRERASGTYFRHANEISVPFAQVATDRCYFLSGSRLSAHELNTRFRARLVLWAEQLGRQEGVLIAVRRSLRYRELRRVQEFLATSKIHIIVAGEEQHIEVALLDAAGTVLSLGIIRKIDYSGELFRITTPLAPALIEKIAVIQFGLVRLLPNGTEVGSIEAGRF